MHGACLIIPKIKDAKTICELIEKYKIMVLPSSPTFLNLILISEEYKNYDLSSLRMITYGTETMPQSLLLKLKEVFRRLNFYKHLEQVKQELALLVQNHQTLYL